MKSASDIASAANAFLENYLEECECDTSMDIAKVCTPIILACSQEVQNATDRDTAYGILQLVVNELHKQTDKNQYSESQDVESIIKGLSYLESRYSSSKEKKRLYFSTVLKYAMGSLKRELGIKETKRTVKMLLEKIKTHTQPLH